MYFNLSQAIYDGTKQRRCREAISSYKEPRLAWSLLWLILRGKCIVVMLCCDGLGANRSFHTIHRLKRCSGWYFFFRTSWPDLNEFEWQILISCFFFVTHSDSAAESYFIDLAEHWRKKKFRMILMVTFTGCMRHVVGGRCSICIKLFWWSNYVLFSIVLFALFKAPEVLVVYTLNIMQSEIVEYYCSL